MARGSQLKNSAISGKRLLYGPRQGRSASKVIIANDLNWLQYNQTIAAALKKMRLIDGFANQIKRDTVELIINLADGSQVRLRPQRDERLHGLSIATSEASRSGGGALAHFKEGPSLAGNKLGGKTSDLISRLIAPELARSHFDYIDLRSDLDSIEAHRRLGYTVQIGGGYQATITSEMEREEIIAALRAHQRLHRLLSPQQSDQVGRLISDLSGDQPTETMLASELGRQVLSRPLPFRVHLR